MSFMKGSFELRNSRQSVKILYSRIRHIAVRDGFGSARLASCHAHNNLATLSPADY